jgi:hypothetical protein
VSWSNARRGPVDQKKKKDPPSEDADEELRGARLEIRSMAKKAREKAIQ